VKSAVKNIPIESLDVHPTVQRVEGIDHKRVQKMADDFQPHLLQVLTVSSRSDGKNLVVDGAHRLTTCKKVGFNSPLRCEVFTGLSIAEEASLFLGRNNAKMPSSISKYHARVLMGDPVAVDIERILTEAGWKVDPADEVGNVAAIDSVELVYKESPEILARTFRIITLAWEWDSRSSNGCIVRGVA